MRELRNFLDKADAPFLIDRGGLLGAVAVFAA
jgi:hypothetical protein